MRLDEALEGITKAFVEAIEKEIKEDGLLPDVAEVIRGDKARVQPKTPNLWVFPEVDARQVHEPTTIREKWELPVNIVSVVKDDDPEEGYRRANELASKGRSAILKDRTLGLRDVVQDTKTLRFVFSGPGLSDGKNHSAGAVLQVTFLIKE